MISDTSSCLQRSPQDSFHIYQGMDDILYSSAGAAASGTDQITSSHALLYSLSVLREKVQQLESCVSMMTSPNRTQQESIAMGVSCAGIMIQEIILAASSLSCTLPQVGPSTAVAYDEPPPSDMKVESATAWMDHSSNNSLGITRKDDFFSSNNPSTNSAIDVDNGSVTRDQIRKVKPPLDRTGMRKECSQGLSSNGCTIIELDAADLLAKYTHYCQVCGKGFRRDANLRMHMRAHGDEYKSAAALANPTKSSRSSSSGVALKYSCPHDGCRWNRKHAKFQPLKSVVCAKNHYKRSHCPKMYVCNRCNLKQFSVLSDLRTHEKHCGDLRWRCSCGTNFSRKDKLMGHVALFVGHTPQLSRLRD
ncbi:unnamed protein product [Musa hybrid cultivar]